MTKWTTSGLLRTRERHDGRQKERREAINADTHRTADIFTERASKVNLAQFDRIMNRETGASDNHDRLREEGEGSR